MKSCYSEAVCEPMEQDLFPREWTNEELKQRYTELYRNHVELRERFWKQEEEIGCLRRILKGVL